MYAKRRIFVCRVATSKGELLRRPISGTSTYSSHAKFREGPTGERQALSSRTLRSPFSVSEAQKRSLGGWVF
jgi:hypothetical protein